MSDLLVDLGGRKGARQLIKTLGLPIPLPQRLRRLSTPWDERPLHDRNVVVWAHGELTETLANTLGAAGANPFVDGDLAPFLAHGEAWARPPAEATAESPSRPNALVFDGTALRSVDDLRAVYNFFNARIKSLGTCGRIVVLARPHSKMKTTQGAAAQRALDGFVRSCGKEVGRNGSTANLVIVNPGAEERLGGLLRFLLSDRSAYITGQPITVSKTVRMSADVPLTRPLQGKTALVTGAARGIGAAIARSLAREGAHVLCLDRPADDGPLSEIVAEVGGTAVLVDVTDPDAASIIAAAAEPHGGIDIAVHNAGVTRDKTLARMDESLWDMTLQINLGAVIGLIEGLPINTNGRVVCLSSIAGIAGNVGQTNYAASKAGVIGVVEHLGPNLARRGVAINAIAPGFIETRLTKAIPTATREVARRLCNLSQGGLPTDIAEVATFLASPQAGALCGQVVRVCGGSFIGA